LVVGYNTIMIPLNRSDLNMAGLVGNATNSTIVSYWNNTLQRFVAAAYYDWLGDRDNNFPIQNGSVLMVYTPSATTFYSIGNLPATNPTYNLVVGNNTIMIPLNRSDLNMASLVGNATNATTVCYWDNTAQMFLSAVYIDWLDEWDNNFPTSIGDPLMVNSNSTGIFPGMKDSNNILKNVGNKRK